MLLRRRRVCLGVGQPAFFAAVPPLRALFSTEIFMPRGHEYLWTPKLLLLEGVSNALLALACLALAVAIARGRGAPSRRARRRLALFVALSAATHLFDVWVIWAPLYWLDALVRSAAALAAVGAAASFMAEQSGDRGDR
jgi:two-component system NtrC family sensor kinase